MQEKLSLFLFVVVLIYTELDCRSEILHGINQALNKDNKNMGSTIGKKEEK